MLGFILHSLSGGDFGVHEVIGMPTGAQKKEPNKSDKRKIEQKIIKWSSCGKHAGKLMIISLASSR